MEQSQSLARRLTAEAVAALEGLGDGGRELRELADRLTERKH